MEGKDVLLIAPGSTVAECKESIQRYIAINGVEVIGINFIPDYFKVDYGMFNVDACMSVPSDYSHEIPTEFGLNEKKEYSFSFNIEMKSLIPAFEHGLLLCEIDEMLSKLPDDSSGIIEFRANDYGEMEMLSGGVLETFRASNYGARIEDPNVKSNSHKMPLQARDEDELKKKDLVDDLFDRKMIK